jgi:hypothetical protein
MKLSIRQAAPERDLRFEALAAFANMGDSQEDWDRLRLMHPEMFDEYWLLTPHEEWALSLFDPSQVRPLSNDEAEAILPRRLRYRDCLRNVWARNDREGRNLRVLYGFDLTEKDQIAWGCPAPSPLPSGSPIVDGGTGEIRWEFPSGFQRTLYELMRVRWHAMICLQCGRYFIADKTAQKYCSTNCSDEAKLARSNEHWRTKGRFNRQARQDGISSTRKERGERNGTKKAR